MLLLLIIWLKWGFAWMCFCCRPRERKHKVVTTASISAPRPAGYGFSAVDTDDHDDKPTVVSSSPGDDGVFSKMKRGFQSLMPQRRKAQEQKGSASPATSTMPLVAVTKESSSPTLTVSTLGPPPDYGRSPSPSPVSALPLPEPYRSDATGWRMHGEKA